RESMQSANICHCSLNACIRISVTSSLLWLCVLRCFSIFFFNDTASTEIYTLSLHDALPISVGIGAPSFWIVMATSCRPRAPLWGDRKSTRLNSSHVAISYAVFCLKKKKLLLLSAHACPGSMV